VRSLSLHLVVLALTLGLRSVPDTVEKKVDGGAKTAHDKVPDTVHGVHHVKRYDAVEDLTGFFAEFEVSLVRVGASLVLLIFTNY
jgi:hypothetical protein